MDEALYLQQAKANMSLCKMCKECNGEVCRGWTPGPGGKGTGSTFVRNVAYYKKVQIKMAIIGQDSQPDTSFSFYSSVLSAPIMAAPISNVKINYGSSVDESTYLEGLIEGMHDAGLLSFLGDAPAQAMFDLSLQSLKKLKGKAIVTIKPWELPAFLNKLEAVLACDPMAVAIDIDAGGLTSLRTAHPKVTFMSVEQLKIIKQKMGLVPLILKGIMTISDALMALEVNADAIIVSNHGGRVMDHGESSIEALKEIADAVNHRCLILIDGGIRSGSDVFKALALGADAVLIGRPFSHASIGSGKEGVVHLANKLTTELKDIMMMTQCATLSDIDFSKVKVNW